MAAPLLLLRRRRRRRRYFRFDADFHRTADQTTRTGRRRYFVAEKKMDAVLLRSKNSPHATWLLAVALIRCRSVKKCRFQPTRAKKHVVVVVDIEILAKKREFNRVWGWRGWRGGRGQSNKAAPMIGLFATNRIKPEPLGAGGWVVVGGGCSASRR